MVEMTPDETRNFHRKILKVKRFMHHHCDILVRLNAELDPRFVVHLDVQRNLIRCISEEIVTPVQRVAHDQQYNRYIRVLWKEIQQINT